MCGLVSLGVSVWVVLVCFQARLCVSHFPVAGGSVFLHDIGHGRGEGLCVGPPKSGVPGTTVESGDRCVTPCEVSCHHATVSLRVAVGDFLICLPHVVTPYTVSPCIACAALCVSVWCVSFWVFCV